MDVKTFTNNLLGANIRCIIDDGELWFLGTDVASALGYARPGDAIDAHVDTDDRKTLFYKGFGEIAKPIIWTKPNDFANKVIINESGLYALIFGSKLDSAKEFKNWVTKEVLPSIRKYGGYIYNQESLSMEEFEKLKQQVTTLAEMVNKLKEQKNKKNQKLIAANKKLEQNKQIRKQYLQLTKILSSNDNYINYLINECGRKNSETRYLLDENILMQLAAETCDINISELVANLRKELNIHNETYVPKYTIHVDANGFLI